MSDETRRFRLAWTTRQEHARTFTLAELRELASQDHDIFYDDGEPDLNALEAMNDDGFFAGITTEDTFMQTTWAAMDRADEADPYGRVLEYGRAPAARRVTWRITAGDRLASLDAGPYAHAVAATPAAAVEFLRRACELIRARSPHLARDGTPPGYEATAEMPELVLTAGPHAACVFTDPAHGAEASALAAEITRDEGRPGIRLDIDARALASASGQLPACQRSPR
jgi:hypothetical protein